MSKDPTSELANEPAAEATVGEHPVERPPAEHAFFGHPRGLATLFFTEFWERFSYYGMRGLLFLFMVAAAVDGGLGFDESKAGAVYGLYVAGVYLLALPGGWLADRLFGQQRAIFIGGTIIAAGHFSMAIPHLSTFYLGLVLIVIGTGLLKPNISAIVGELYPEGGARRDAGFSIFYMGINLGAFVAPLVCGYLGEKIDWHWGFGAAGVGMVAGLIQYRAGRKYFGKAGLLQTEGRSARRPGSRAPDDLLDPGRQLRDHRRVRRPDRDGHHPGRHRAGRQRRGGGDRRGGDPVLRLRDPGGRPDHRREEAGRRHRHAVLLLVPVLDGVRAGRRVDERVRPRHDRPDRRRLGDAGELAPVGQPDLHHPAGAGVRRRCGCG